MVSREVCTSYEEVLEVNSLSSERKRNILETANAESRLPPITSQAPHAAQDDDLFDSTIDNNISTANPHDPSSHVMRISDQQALEEAKQSAQEHSQAIIEQRITEEDIKQIQG